MLSFSLTRINRSLYLLLLILQQCVLIVWMLVAPMIWKCRHAGSTGESWNTTILVMKFCWVKIFWQSQISVVYIVDFSRSADRKKNCNYSIQEILEQKKWLFFKGHWTKQCYGTYSGWIGFVLFLHEDIQYFHSTKGLLPKKTTLLPVHVSMREENVM